MTFDSQFISSTYILPDDDEEERIRRTQIRDNDMALAINQREVAVYPNAQEILSGRIYYNTADPQNFRAGFRKGFGFGAIAAGATLTIAHGITNLIQIVEVTCNVKTDTPDFRPVPFVDPGLITTGIGLRSDTTNIYIVNGATAPNITEGYVVLDYLRN